VEEGTDHGESWGCRASNGSDAIFDFDVYSVSMTDASADCAARKPSAKRRELIEIDYGTVQDKLIVSIIGVREMD